MKRIAIVGAGPAGLMAAEAALAAGAQVTVYEAMPSPARKLLMAGKSGLNITHSGQTGVFVSRYHCPDRRLDGIVGAFDPRDVTAWMAGLGIASFMGSSGRVFPVSMKASPLLRSWLVRLRRDGLVLHTNHRWLGWTPSGCLLFRSPDGEVAVAADATILALGGASWPRLGSDGAWQSMLAEQGVRLEPFRPSNCGVRRSWSDRFVSAQEGCPLKNVALLWEGQVRRGDLMITRMGIEGAPVYAISADIGRRIAALGSARLTIDLLPDTDEQVLAARLARGPASLSLSNRLRRTARLDPVKIALIHEIEGGCRISDPGQLAALIKGLEVTVTGTDSLARAISSAGGVAWEGLDRDLMLKQLPGTYCVGEMVDWDAPTGGYLLTACLAMGRHAGARAAGCPH